MQSKMKIFAVLLVSSVAVCLAASDKKVEKNVEKSPQKRGLLGLHEYQHAAPFLHAAEPFIPSPQLISSNGFIPSELAHPGAPVITEARALAAPALPLAPAVAAAPALPLASAFAHETHYAHGYAHAYAAEHLPLAHASHLAAPALAAPALPLAHSAPLAHAALPLAAAPVHQVPTQVNEIIKKVAVPYERHIHVDNPVYTPFERHVPVDNPVPVLKYVKQSYPVHIDEPVQVPHIREVHVPAPYIQKLPVVIQRVVKEYVPQQQQIVFAQQQQLFAPAPQPTFLAAAPQPALLAAAPQPAW